MKKNKASLSLIISISIFLLWTFFLLSANHTLLAAFPLADKRLFLFINGIHNTFWDQVMYYASSKTFWFPFYAVLIFFLWKAFGKKVWQLLLTIAFLILTADQVGSHLIKNFIGRLRPSHEPELASVIHLSKAGMGGFYGFVSSHAANTFAITIFLTLLLDKSYLPLKIILFLWAFLVSYSRIYNGVHYPLDVLCGSVLGVLIGIVFYYLYQGIFMNQNGFEH